MNSYEEGFFLVIANTQPPTPAITLCICPKPPHTKRPVTTNEPHSSTSAHVRTHPNWSSPKVHFDLQLFSALLQSVPGDSAKMTAVHLKQVFLMPFTVHHLCPSNSPMKFDLHICTKLLLSQMFAHVVQLEAKVVHWSSVVVFLKITFIFNWNGNQEAFHHLLQWGKFQDNSYPYRLMNAINTKWQPYVSGKSYSSVLTEKVYITLYIYCTCREITSICITACIMY